MNLQKMSRLIFQNVNFEKLTVIFFYDKYLPSRLKFSNKKPRFILLRK